MQPRLEYLWLELTTRCNLNCIHCYAESGPRQTSAEILSLDDWFLALHEAARLDCRKVQFIGGEPTLHPDLPRLISQARSLGFEFIEVYTNGTAFNSSLKDVFLRHHVALAFSVYSDEAASHEAVTLRSGSFQKTMESIRWAMDQQLPVRAGIVEMDANRARMDSTKRHLREIGVRHVRHDRMRAVGRGNTAHAVDALGELCGSCVKDRLCVAATGAIYPCVFSRSRPVGNLKNGLAAALIGKKMSRFRNDMAQIQHSRTKHHPMLNKQIDNLCIPDAPPVPCDPALPPVPCDPALPPVPCDPALPPVPCDPAFP